MMQLPTHQPAHDRRTTPRSGHAPGMLPAWKGRVLLGAELLGVLSSPDAQLVTLPSKGLSQHLAAHPLQGLALHLASQAGEIDTAQLAEALGQNPAAPSAAAYRAVAMDALQHLESAGVLIRRGTRPAFFWTLP